MSTFENARFVIVVLQLLAWGSAAFAQPAASFQWQTELGQSYQHAKSEGKPLVVYVYSENENGPLEPCKALEDSVFASREFKLLGSTSVFARLNSAPEQGADAMNKFLQEANITLVPTVCVIQCNDDEMVLLDSIVGSQPLLNYVRELRTNIVEAALRIRTNGRSECSNDDLVHGLKSFNDDIFPLQSKLETTYDAHNELLQQLSDGREFDVDLLLESDRQLLEYRSQVVDCLLNLAALNTPDIADYCRLEIELHMLKQHTAIMLSEDLLAIADNGKLTEGFRSIMARIAITTAQGKLDAEFAALKSLEAGIIEKLNQRVAQAYQSTSVQVANR